MEVDAEPALAQHRIVTPPANPGSPEPRIWRPSPARLLPSFAAGPSKKEPLEEATREHLSSGSANAEVVASTPQATQPRSPPAGTSPHAASTAAAQGSAQEGKPPVVLSPTREVVPPLPAQWLAPRQWPPRLYRSLRVSPVC